METKTIQVKVFPGARKEKVIENTDSSFDIFVREPAQKNLANTRVREVVAKYFGVGLENVIIKTGHRSRKKILAIS